MTGIEIFAWLVLAFADGPDCLLQASVHLLPEGPAWVREDGCAVHSQQEGSHIVFWSDARWVAIKIPHRRTVAVLPVGARSGLCEWEERDSPIWEHGCQTDTAFAESGPSRLARQMESQHSSDSSTIPSS